ncbi:hypothetical protein EC988_004071 [Linderina pennispora]|nr:hypothetical protein EC988_004071 [Linderina pennispora]
MVGCGMEPPRATRHAGQIVVLIGLGIQLLFLGAFLVTVMYVWKDPEMSVVRAPGDQTQEVAKKRLMQVLTVTTLLLYVRLVYRIVNYASGFGGVIYRSEWALYTFDSLMVLVCFIIYVVRFVGHYFPADGRTAEEVVLRST